MCREQHEVDLPEVGRYATGILFLDIAHHEESEGLFAVLARECELKVSYTNISKARPHLSLLLVF